MLANNICPLSFRVNSNWRILMSHYIWIRLIFSWAWNLIPNFFLWFSADSKSLCIITKINTVRIITWSRFLKFFFTNKISSLTLRVNFYRRTLITIHICIRWVFSWSWYIITNFILRFFSNCESLGIISEVSCMRIITWSWLINFLLTY